jgi:hypothetical protein
MVRSRRESHHSDGITGQKSLQRTSATKSAQSGHSTADRQCLLSGIKRTWRAPNTMSASDPLRKSRGSICCDAQRRSNDMVVCGLRSGEAREATRIHHAIWRNGSMAARGERAAAGDAGNRVPQQQSRRCQSTVYGGISRGTIRCRFRGRQKCCYRIPLGRRTSRASSRAYARFDSASS